jgi:hypothetical protein
MSEVPVDLPQHLPQQFAPVPAELTKPAVYCDISGTGHRADGNFACTGDTVMPLGYSHPMDFREHTKLRSACLRRCSRSGRDRPCVAERGWCRGDRPCLRHPLPGDPSGEPEVAAGALRGLLSLRSRAIRAPIGLRGIARRVRAAPVRWLGGGESDSRQEAVTSAYLTLKSRFIDVRPIIGGDRNNRPRRRDRPSTDQAAQLWQTTGTVPPHRIGGLIHEYDLAA